MSVTYMPIVTAQQVVDEARSLIGTPFHHQGRVAGLGVDCIGVPILVGRSLGLLPADWDVTGYAATPDGVTLKSGCDAHLEPSAVPEPGGMVLIAWGVAGAPQHLAIVVPYRLSPGVLSIIHADSRRHRTVVEQRLVWDRSMRLVAPYRFRGVDYSGEVL